MYFLIPKHVARLENNPTSTKDQHLITPHSETSSQILIKEKYEEKSLISTVIFLRRFFL